MSVIIVGAGMSGSTLALALSAFTQDSIPIDVIELRTSLQEHADSDAKAIALTALSCEKLKCIGIWPALAEVATAINKIHVSDQQHIGIAHLSTEDCGKTALGQVIEANTLEKRLFALLKHKTNIRLHCPARVVKVTRDEKTISVALDNKEQLTGQLLVAAGGSVSFLEHEKLISYEKKNSQQVAIVASVLTEKEHQHCAFERFTPTGPLALLPMMAGRSAVVWCQHEMHYKKIMAWKDEDFLQHLQQAFGWRLGKILQVSKRHGYVLQQTIAKTHISHRLALVGNAAQTLHPVAGQGFNLALRDVLSLAELVATAFKNNVDIGEYSLLHAYRDRRQQDQSFTIKITEGLLDVFINDYQPLQVTRNIALRIIEHIPILRRQFISKMLGM